MSEVINGLSKKEKDVIEIAQKLADYLIEKEQVKSNEYIGKVEKVDRLEIASKLARNLREKGEELQDEIVKDLQEDFKKIEPVKENYYYMCKLLKLIVEVKELEPIREIEIVKVNEKDKIEILDREFVGGYNDTSVFNLKIKINNEDIITVTAEKHNFDMQEPDHKWEITDKTHNLKPEIYDEIVKKLEKDFSPVTENLKDTVYKIESDRPGEPKVELVQVLSKDKDKVQVQSINEGYVFYYERNFFEKNSKIATKEDIENYEFRINNEDINKYDEEEDEEI